MHVLTKMWEWIEYNRFIVIMIIVAAFLWIAAFSCTPQVSSPLNPGLYVDARGLEIEYKTWQTGQDIMAARFEAAGQDLAEQKANNEKIEQLLTDLASGGIADLPGLLKLLFAGGAIGAISDNIRKRGLICGLKKNK